MELNILTKSVVKWKLKYVWCQVSRPNKAKFYRFSLWQIHPKYHLSDFEELPRTQFLRYIKYFWFVWKINISAFPWNWKKFENLIHDLTISK